MTGEHNGIIIGKNKSIMCQGLENDKLTYLKGSPSCIVEENLQVGVSCARRSLY